MLCSRREGAPLAPEAPPINAISSRGASIHLLEISGPPTRDASRAPPGHALRAHELLLFPSFFFLPLATRTQSPADLADARGGECGPTRPRTLAPAPSIYDAAK